MHHDGQFWPYTGDREVLAVRVIQPSLRQTMATVAPKGPEGELQISAPDPENDARKLIDLI
jgi:hypothetical protein